MAHNFTKRIAEPADGITADAESSVYACLFLTGEITNVNMDGSISIIASGPYTPATPVVRNGALYATTLQGKGMHKIPFDKCQLRGC